ncbi:hypothetical protein MHYP_G00082920 [Metynnis hypsauchen]
MEESGAQCSSYLDRPRPKHDQFCYPIQVSHVTVVFDTLHQATVCPLRVHARAAVSVLRVSSSHVSAAGCETRTRGVYRRVLPSLCDHAGSRALSTRQ